jgi:hypothetical protein
MRTLFQFVEVWGGYLAFTAGSFSILLWLLSTDGDPSTEKAASSILWSTFWPLRWLYCRLTGKVLAPAGSRALRSGKSAERPRFGSLEQDKQGFRTIREAKDYLASRIAQEAQCDGTPLTEVERKMLYFTETGWTLPDMKEVSAEFDRNYDQSDYEKKISELVARIQDGLTDKSRQEQTTWALALERLSQGDHYLLALVDAANPTRTGARRNLKLLIIAFVLFAYAVLNTYFTHWMRDH